MDIQPWSLLWRPLVYSLFLKVFLMPGMWALTMLVQNTFVSGALYFASNTLHKDLKSYQFLLMSILLCLTPLPFTSNFILPDVFSGFALISASFFLLKVSKNRHIANTLIFIFSSSLHYSSILTSFLLGLVLCLKKSFKDVKLILFSVIFSFLLVSTVHFFIAKRFSFSNTAHILLYSRFVALEVAQEHLKEHCETEKYKLCQHREEGFHIWRWGRSSQIGKLGGLHAISSDISRINYDIVFSPRILDFMGRSMKNIFTQIVSFSDPIIPVYENEYLSGELNIYSTELNSIFNKQASDDSIRKVLDFMSWIYFVLTLVSILYLMFQVVRKKGSAELRAIFGLLILGYLFNALVCGGLTDPISRYSNRLIWVFPWLSMMFLMTRKKESPEAK